MDINLNFITVLALSPISTREEVVVWARKKTGVPVIRLSSTNEAEEFHHKHQTFIMGLFENYEVWELFGFGRQLAFLP